MTLGFEATLTFFAAVLFGIRHATDPDHLTAVSTLVLSRDTNGARRAGVLGLAWGMGHAMTLLAFGIPLLLFAGHAHPHAESLGRSPVAAFGIGMVHGLG